MESLAATTGASTAPRHLVTYGSGPLPVIRRLAELSHANEAKVREALTGLPAQLDEVDRLIAAGTIGGDLPNAADFQVLSTVRVLLEFEELAELMEGRASVPLARRLYPLWPGPAPRGLPVS